jgi:hypothetical protein
MPKTAKHSANDAKGLFASLRSSKYPRPLISQSTGDVVLGRLDTMAGSPLPSSTPLGSVSSRRYRVKSLLLVIDPNNQYEDKIKPST